MIDSDLVKLGRFLATPTEDHIDGLTYDIALYHSVGAYFSDVVETHLDSKIMPVPPDIAIRTAIMESSAKHLIQDSQMYSINQLLTTNGIKPIWIKGAALAHTIYPKSVFRSRGDLDIIVSKHEFPRALSLIKEAGYYEDKKNKLQSPINTLLEHHVALRKDKSPFMLIELHHSLLGYAFDKDIPDAVLERWLHENYVFYIDGQKYFTFKPEVHIVYLSAHMLLQHGLRKIVLRGLLDIHLLCEKYDIDWGIVLHEATNLKWTHIVETCLNMVDECFDKNYSSQFNAQLKYNVRVSEDITRTLLLSGDDTTGELLLRQLRKLDWKNKIIAIYRVAVPSGAYMRKRYRIAASKSVIPYYFHRWGYQATGLGKTLLKRLSVSLQNFRTDQR